MAFGEAKPLWGFDWSQWARWRQAGGESADDIVAMRDGDDAGLDSGMRRRPRGDVVGA